MTTPVWRRLAALTYPLGWFLGYQAYVFIGVFLFGKWDPKLGGAWGTVEFLQVIGVVAVGVPVLSYGLGLSLCWQRFRSLTPVRAVGVSLLTLGAHILLLAGYVGLASALDFGGRGWGFVEWSALVALAIAPLPLVCLSSIRLGAGPT